MTDEGKEMTEEERWGVDTKATTTTESYKERVRQALVDNLEKQGRVPQRFKPLVSHGAFFGTEPEKAKPKRADLNEKARGWMKRRGWVFWRADYWDAHGGVSRDLFGILDYVAFAAGETIGVQITSANNVSARATKIKSSPWAATLKSARWKIVVVGFYGEPRREPKVVEI